MMQCFLEVSLSPAWRLPGVFQGPGRRGPKKKSSGSESEEEEQVGQGASCLASRGVSRRPRSRPLGASASSPARPSCSGLDRSSPLWVPGLEREAAAGRAAREMVAASSGAQSPSSTLPSLASPVPGRVSNAHLRAGSLPIRDPSGAGPTSPFQLGSGLPPRPRAVRVATAAATPLPGSPAPPRRRPPEGGRVPSPGASPAPHPQRWRGMGSGGPWSAPARDAR